MRKLSTLFMVLAIVSCKVNERIKPNTVQERTELKEHLKPQTPIMGWSSWNNFRVNINEEVIKA